MRAEFCSDPVPRPSRKIPSAPGLGPDQFEALHALRYDPALGLFDGMLRVAAIAPEAVAVRCGPVELTYAALAARADDLAQRLLAAGIARGDRVGLVSERGVEAILAMLACARVGAAYAPLVPTYHEAQLPVIAADVAPRLILWAAGLQAQAQAAAPAGTPLLPIAGGDAPAAPLPFPAVEGGDVAFILYTSGSTGKPKGVQLCHRGLGRLAFDQPIELFRPGERVLQSSTLATDLSTAEIWGPLMVGGTIVVVDQARASVEAILATLETQGADVATFYTGIFHLIVETHPEALRNLRLTSSGGDTLSAPLVARLMAACPGLDIVNMYGPTETSVYATLHRVTPEDVAAGVMPLGRAMGHTLCCVLDEAMQDLPDGEPGQCAIGGDAVAAGYLNRAELTAEKFIDDPRPGRTGKLYLTGDVVLRRPDGVLLFRGRVDRQVKLAGRRIELDEIEAVLRRSPLLADAAVAVVPGAGAGDEGRIAAFVKPAGAASGPDLLRRLRAELAGQLPDALIPRIFRQHDSLPLTGNGKVDRKRLVADYLAEAPAAAPVPAAAPAETPARHIERRPDLETAFAEPQGDLETWIARTWCDLIGVDRVGRDDRFFELGGTSLMAMRFLERLRAERGLPLSVASFFDRPTVRDIARQVQTPDPAPGLRAVPPRPAPRPAAEARIAIVGLGGRFAGARDVAAFWDMLLAGRSGRVQVTREDLIAAGEDPALLDDPDYVAACFPLEEAESFDAQFFGFNPREVELMDPQQRLLLEVAWTTLEDAGHDPRQGGNRIGVFTGVGRNAYMLHNLMSHPGLRASAHEYGMLIGNERDFPSTHIAYRLGLHGPALTVQTACSTSGVAIHMAAEALRRGECDLALAGGAKVLVPNRVGYMYTEGGPLAPDGMLRAFDADARGMVRGSGAAMVALKRLDDALAAGDHIHAVLIGSAINNDGAEKAGFTAPSVSGQAEVIAGAHAAAGISADSVTLIEAHGTGTELGDPIEVEGLTRAFRQTTDRAGFCALGSVKTNIGHLDAGATAAGLIKAALALQHRTIPPSLNYTRPNPRIGFEGSPFFVADSRRDWPQGDGPRRAGISSFGLGGTNVHLVIEEAPVPAPRAPRAAGTELLVLSARSPAALAQRAADLAQWFEAHPEADLADVAHTLRTGRRRFEHRLVLLARTPAEAARQLREMHPQRVLKGGTALAAAPVAFLFPGGGAQYPGMALGLYDANPTFRAALDRAAAHLAQTAGWSLLDLLRREGPLEDTAEALPALFAVEYAMAQVWLGLGLTPRGMIGHSVGEYAAACVAGVFSLEDALDIVLARGRLFETLAPGAMLSVPLTEADLAPRLPEGLAIAAVNRPDSLVVSGPVAAIEAFAQVLEAEEIEARRVHINVAAHSPMVEPILQAFGDAVRKARLNPPKLPFLSNLTGTWITADQATDPDYWVRHLRSTVRFADGAAALLAQGEATLIEVGPGNILAGLCRQHPARGAGHEVLASIRHPQDATPDADVLLAAIGRYWMAGGDPDWQAVSPGPHRKLPLPTYPFQRSRYWVDALPFDASAANQAAIPALHASAAAAAAPQAAPETAPEPAADLPRPDLPRKDRILGLLTGIVSRLSGLSADRVLPQATFLELGFDSLFLTQLNAAFRKAFAVKLTTRQLMESLSCLDLLAVHLDSVLPADARIDGAGSAATAHPTAAAIPAAVAAAAATGGAAPAPVRAEDSPGRPTVKKTVATELTAAQEAHIDALIAAVTVRTPKAKAEVQQNRRVLADPRTVQGFRSRWKEMVYPVLSDRAQGSKIWDIDGNEYIDLVGGYGITFFGHRPDFITRAIREQLERTTAIGPQTVLAGEVAQIVSDLTGMERVAFCNTGSEAVLAGVRMARTVSGKSKIVKFDGHYHGIFDEMQVRGSGTGPRLMTVPSAPGIPPEAVQNTIIVKYGDPAAFDVIRAEADEIAVVLVEPVRSRNPDYQPREYLQELRRITRELGIALLFDEMVTGFRSHPGGAQHLFGIRADIATYGKVAGGGLPIGIVTGSAAYMDALDGGFWQFGDDSAPPADMTWFAGTFVRHPLSLAAAKAALGRMREAGPALQEGLNVRAAALAAAMNAEARRLSSPLKVECFSSVLRISFTEYQDYSDLLFFHLRNRGILTYEGRPIFLTTAHDEADYAAIVTAWRESLSALVGVGLISGRDPDALRRIPMSPGQQEIWITAQFSPESSCAYNLCSTLDLTGPLDDAALTRALDDLVARHEALRSVPDADGATQTLHPRLDLPFERTDLAGMEHQARADRLEALRQAEVRTPFDLARGPLIRCRLIRLAPDHHQLLLTVHHVIADGWSCGVLMRDLGQLYDARHRGAEPDLGPTQQLSDFIAFQTMPDQVASRAEARDYWLNLYDGELARVEFPSDHPRPKTRTFAGHRLEIPVPMQVWADLKATAKANGTTLFAALIGGFAAYLTRLTGVSDNALGFAAAGQPLLGGGGLVGHCVNFLPLKLRADLSQGYGAHLKSVGSSILDALENQNFDFVSFVQELQPNRTIDWAPLISAGVNLDPSSRGVDFGTLKAAAGSVGRAYEHLDLFLNFVETEHELLMQCTYNTGLFGAEEMRRRLEEYLQLMAAGAAAPDRPMADLPLVRPEERGWLLAAARQVDRPHPRDRSLAQLFRDAAARLPGKAAIVVPGMPEDPARKVLTYADLDALSDAWAARLQAAGVGPGDFVPLLLHRSSDYALAVLSVLKTGAAYVPIEPETTRARCEFLLADCAAKVLMTHADLTHGLDAGRCRLMMMDRPDASGMPLDVRPAPVAHDPEGAAYMMYTSGSTGEPKGVIVPHRGVTRLIFGNDYARMDETRVTAQMTAVGFDLSTWEIWSVLAHGGTLVVPRGDRVPDLALLKHMFRDGGVNALMISTAIFNGIIDEDPSVFEGVDEIIVAGEAMSGLHVRRAQAALPDIRLINGYGPTEATVIVTAWPVPRDPGADLAAIPIGRPINATAVYVTDDRQNLLPPGVPGELVLGGDGVALGYWRRPDQTAAAFVPDRIGGEPGRMLYRTGDIGRIRPDGVFEYICRRDAQVKVRGVRVELGEVEAALNAVPGVRSAAILHDAARGRLVGFAVPEDPLLTEARVARALKLVLPRHVLPARTLLIDQMPLSKNGKIDRKALAQRLAEGVDSDTGAPPATPTEHTLAAIWSDILGTPVRSAEDSFFDLGGHSLQAVRMVSRIRRDFGCDLAIGTLFTHPTLRDLAELIDKASLPVPGGDARDRPWDTTLVLDPGPGTAAAPVFIVGGIGGNLNDMVDITRELGAYRPVIGFQSRGILGHRPRESIVEMATEHLRYIRRHQPVGPYRLIGYSAGAVTAFEMARQLEERGESVARLILLDGTAPAALAATLSTRVTVAERMAHEMALIRDQGVLNLLGRTGAWGRNLLARINPATTRHGEIAEAWRKAYFSYPGGRYCGRIALILTNPDGYHARKIAREHPLLGWDAYVDPSRISVHRVGSGHRSMLVGEEARAVTALVRRLDEANP